MLDDSDTGYNLNAGIRGVPTPGLELGLGLAFTDLYDETDTSINTYAKYFFNDGQFGLGMLYQTSSDIDLFGISFTWKSKTHAQQY